MNVMLYFGLCKILGNLWSGFVSDGILGFGGASYIRTDDRVGQSRPMLRPRCDNELDESLQAE